MSYDYRIRYDRGCYKCQSNYCPGNCPEPAHLRKRSLAELDDVIDEIIDRNPEWVEKINRIIEEKRNE